MYFDLETVLRMFAESYFTQLTVVEPPFTGLESFDRGIRKMLVPDFDFEAFGNALLEKTPENTIVLTKDEFNCSYGIFRVPNDPQRVYILGCTIRNPIKAETQDQLLHQYGSEKFKKFMRIYQHIPVDHDSGGRAFLNRVYVSAFPGIELEEVVLTDYLPMPLLQTAVNRNTEPKAEPSDYILLQGWVNLELQIMSCIESGDSEQALAVIKKMERVSLPEVLSNPDQSIRQQAYEMNATCKYVVNATQKVHPGYTLEIYKIFDSKIQSASDHHELSLLVNQMILSYCECLKKHSLEQYSPLIRRVINHIHLNATASLSLRSLALICNVNPSYLSKQFKIETGVTVTEYINNHRVELSVPFLRFTQMGIAQVSEKVGFLDENYYARVFKRTKGISPKAYRQLNQI